MSRKTLKELGSNWQELFELLNKTEDFDLSLLDKALEKCLRISVYVTCQIVIYSRTVLQCNVELSSKACVAIAHHLSGLDFGKPFYEKVLLNPGDMNSIFRALKRTQHPYKGKLTSAMKKGFKSKIESLTVEELLTYKYYLIDIINLTHPISSNPNQIYNLNGESLYALDIVMQGIEVPEEMCFKDLPDVIIYSPEEHFENIININL